MSAHGSPSPAPGDGVPVQNGSMPPFQPPVGGFPPNMMLPPLPPNWSQHMAPDGKTPYFYNNITKQSTYVRPLAHTPPPPPPPAGMGPSFLAQPHTAAGPSQALPVHPVVPAQPAKKKEKPKEKIPIPGTTWTKVITNQGNVFYTEKESKRSSWTIPEEIEVEVKAYEAEQKAEKIRKETEARLKEEEEKQAVARERERIRKEIEEENRARREAETREKQALDQERERKRKERELEEQGESDESGRPSKVAKRDHENDEGQEAEEEDQGMDAIDDDDDEGQAGPLDDDDEEAWQKAVAAEIAAEHAIEEAAKKAAKQEKKEAEEEAKRAVFAAPTQVELSVDEGKALFKALLFEKDISPFSPWDTSLPLFINDPRYILLSSLKDRQDVFEEYCRDVARSRRLNKAGVSKSASHRDDKKEPEKEYRDLLRAEVKSTRTIWEDFRRAWKKDRRFFGFGKDDRQREKVFRTHLKELGERKRADAQRAEADFLELLGEAKDLGPDSQWKEVKKPLVSDARYDAVGSSSLREELFNRHVKSLTSAASASSPTPEDASVRRAQEKKARAEASLREREAKVRGDKAHMERELHRSKVGAGREDGELEFGSLLTQVVKEHNASWSSTLPQLETDSRFHHPALTLADKQRLFRQHLDRIAQKRLESLHKLFAQHAPKLDTPFEDVFPEIVNDFAVTRLQLSAEALEGQYTTWQRVQFQKARQEFDQLLRDNKFIDFWGRMKNKTLDEKAAGVAGEEEEDEEDETGAGGGGKASLIDLAKQINLREMRSVLQNDHRYEVFDHVPEQRDGWLEEYLSNLEVARAVHNTA